MREAGKWKVRIGILGLSLLFLIFIAGCSSKKPETSTSTGPSETAYKAGKIGNVKLTPEIIDNLLSVIDELRDKYPELEDTARQISKKYRDIEIISKFDEFYTEYVNTLNTQDVQQVIKAHNMQPEEFWQYMEVLYKCLLVLEIEKQWQTKKLDKTEQKLRDMMQRGKLSPSVKEKIGKAIDKLEQIKKTVQDLKSELSEENLEAVKDKLPEIEKRMKFHR